VDECVEGVHSILMKEGAPKDFSKTEDADKQ
jgi:hypothetical protein